MQLGVHAAGRACRGGSMTKGIHRGTTRGDDGVDRQEAAQLAPGRLLGWPRGPLGGRFDALSFEARCGATPRRGDLVDLGGDPNVARFEEGPHLRTRMARGGEGTLGRCRLGRVMMQVESYSGGPGHTHRLLHPKEGRVRHGRAAVVAHRRSLEKESLRMTVEQPVRLEGCVGRAHQLRECARLRRRL